MRNCRSVFTRNSPWNGWRIRIRGASLRGRMSPESTPQRLLAPLQRVMLQDSHEKEGAGHHVEQVEIAFKSSVTREAITAAWAATVAHTEALRIAFVIGEEVPLGWERVNVRADLHFEAALPDSWASWLAADRCRRLLNPHEVPWRATFWPDTGRFVWTFHHALLDGRSICRILVAFLRRIAGEAGDDLRLAKWPAPTPENMALAAEWFGKMPGDLEPPDLGLWSAPTAEGSARCCLGVDFMRVLASLAAALESTTATLLTWAWGQALAETGGVRAVLVEQVRTGAPQAGTAGFTMNTLPVVILRACADEAAQGLREFRAQLLALRAIESVSAKDFPPSGFPDTDDPTTSMIMIERTSFSHLAEAVGKGALVESLVLHEGVGETLMATASILPDLRLEVEGLRRHDLLAAWRGVLERLARDFIPERPPDSPPLTSCCR